MKNWLPPVSAQSSAMPDRAAQVGPLVDLVADRVAGPALAVAPRIAILHHEAGHHAMDQAVEEAAPRQRHEVADGQRRVEHRELDSIVPLSVSMNACGDTPGRRSDRLTYGSPVWPGQDESHSSRRSTGRLAQEPAARTRTAESLSERAS